MKNTRLIDGIPYEEWEKMIQDPDFLLKLAYRWKEDRDARKKLEAENAVLKKENAKVKRISEMIEKIDGDELISVTEIAREYGRQATWLNGVLYELGVQDTDANRNWVISDEYEHCDYVRYLPLSFGGKTIPKFTVNHMYWTYKGKQFIYNLLKGDGILPLDEQETTEVEDNE